VSYVKLITLPGRDLNQGPPENGEELLLNQPLFSMLCNKFKLTAKERDNVSTSAPIYHHSRHSPDLALDATRCFTSLKTACVYVIAEET
jgi:hypothetical protein